MALIDHAPQSAVTRRSLGAVSIFASIFAATALGLAISSNDGEYGDLAITLVALAIVAAVVAVIGSIHTETGCVRLIGVIVGILTFGSVGSIKSHGYRNIGIAMLALVLIAVVVAVIRSNRRVVGRMTPRFIPAAISGLTAPIRTATTRPTRRLISITSRIQIALAVALAAQFVALFLRWPVGKDQSPDFLGPDIRRLYTGQIAACGLLILAGLLNFEATRRAWFPGLLLFHALLGFWTVRTSPNPDIDVWHFQQRSADVLLHRGNPYDANQVQFPDIYSKRPVKQQVYGEGMVKNHRLLFGFPYPPLSLFCSTLGYWISGDSRYAQCAALTLAGLLIGYSRPGARPKLAAALLLFTPTEWFVLGRAWTEPFVLMFLAGCVFCLGRRIRWLTPIAFGLFLASKQYAVLAIPLSFLLLPEFDGRSRKSWLAWIALLAGALATTAIVTLPLAIWDFRSFFFSTVIVQWKAPFRWDALSLLVWIGFHIHSLFTRWTWIAFAAVVPAIMLAIRKTRRGPGAFAMALGLVFLVFIAFNKQAFCNYYFFAIGCCCCAIAVAPVASESDEAATSS